MSDRTKHTLLLRLAGPLQSWGTSSRWTERDTGLEPSKSGVIGILAASLGRSRDTPLDDLATLRMGVRVDQEGVPGYDFQTAGAGDDDPGIAMARDDDRIIARRREGLLLGTLKDSARGKSSISNRHFLQDAIFLVGLEGENLDLLHELDDALRKPVFPIGLGRRSYVPSVPVAMPGGGVREGCAIENALRNEPWPDTLVSKLSLSRARRDLTRRLVIETTGTDASATRTDQPIGAAFQTRVFGPRQVVFDQCEVVIPQEDSHART